jgi:hypothetical protein
MPKVRAWERLSDPHYSGHLNMAQFYDLLLEAGYSEEVAQAAANKRGWDRLAAGVMM